MVRFLVIAWPRASSAPKPDTSAQWLPWAFAVTAALIGVWLLPGSMDWLLIKLTPPMIWKTVWPLLFGGALAWLIHRRLGGERAGRSEGDSTRGLAAMFDRWIAALQKTIQPREGQPPDREEAPHAARGGDRSISLESILEAGEEKLRSWPVAGTLLLLILGILMALVTLLR
jgi:hypothetical protein